MSSEGKVKREEASDDDEAPIKKATKVQASLSTCLLVTVNFKDVALREKIKGLGATWCKPLSGWILPESARAAAQTYVDGGEPTAADVARARGGNRGGSLEDPEPTANANAKLVISPHKKAIMVAGETMKVKEVLKALGGSWNKALGGWIFQGSKKDQVLRVLRKDPTNTVEEGSAPAPKKAKSKSADDEFINDDDSESALWYLFNGGIP